MKKRKIFKKRFFIIVLIVLMLGIVLIVNQLTFGNNEKIENQQQVSLKNNEILFDIVKRVENLEISNIKLIKLSNSKVELRGNVKNNSSDFSSSKVIEIKAMDEEKKTIAIFSGIVSELAGFEERTFVTQVLKDITNAVDFEISILNK